MLLAFLWVIWVVFCCYALMVVCDWFFVKSLDVISKKLNLSDNIAWATIMAVWTSAPEFFTALMALLNGGKAGLGAGTIIGSAIFNILCIVWGSALFLNAVVKKWPLLRDITFYTLFIFLILGSFWDGKIVMMEAIWYVALYIVYLLYLKRDNKKDMADKQFVDKVTDAIDDIEENVERNIPFIKYIDKAIELTFPKTANISKNYIYVFSMCIIWIIALSRLLVESGVALASSLWISEVIIWLTVLAAWTSVPDLISSLIVAKQWRGDMAVANAFWSNIFDIWICLGLPWIMYLAYSWKSLTSISVESSDLIFSIGTLLAIVVLVLWVFLVTKFRINKYVWYIFISTYILYVSWAVITSI